MIAIMGDFNARVGNIKIHKNIGPNGENTCNRNGKRLIDFAIYNNMKIMNSWFQHKDSHKYMWSARGQRSIIDYIICNRKLSEMVLDTRVYKGLEIESDHYLVIAPIRIPPRWIQKKPRVLNKELSFRVELLQDPSIKWLFERRVNKPIEEIKEANTIEEEWENI
jgi:hypothetical protein